MVDYFWTKNSYILDDPKINITFQELLQFTDGQITKWVIDVRKKVIEVWDEYDIPPLNGKTRDEIIDEFSKMSGENVQTFLQTDSLDKQKNVIVNNSVLGPSCNQFFGGMMRTKIQHTTKKTDDGKFKGYSVYDLFKEDRFLKRMQLGFRRHFRRDSFYAYSWSIVEGDKKTGIVPCKEGYSWILNFNNKRLLKTFEDYGFWLSLVTDQDNKGSGYTETDANKFLTVSGKEVYDLFKYHNIGDIHLVNVNFAKIKPEDKLAIRVFKKDTRIFPLGFRAFRIGYDNVAVNFPPMTAKYLYETYTNHIKKQDKITIYDPSSGWGGRILGAMALNGDRSIHYVGTDPNQDNYIKDIKKTRYEYLADFFNNNTISESQVAFGFVNKNTYEIFQDGSELISKNKKFQKYKGKLDLVFTSPPYFQKEQYSLDETQSCNKFSEYQEWVNGFLKPTLQTAVEYLKKDRFLIWNIADIMCNGELLPLEDDSRKILESLGMKYIDKLKMALASMPGANRIGKDGKPTAKNFCKLKGRWIKYEPIFVYKKV